MDEKRQRVAETARNLGVSIPDEVKDSKTDDKSHVRDQLLTLNQIYLFFIESSSYTCFYSSSVKICDTIPSVRN